ncbi:MAG: hypothetical protein WCT37_01905 [Patescibacteria group bacterium]|jgi:hypothetical protein
MKPLNKFPKKFFDKYKEKPVKLQKYSPGMRVLADKYVSLLNQMLAGQNARVGVIGSVAYEIPTADVEVAVYTTKSNREAVINILESKFGQPLQREKEFARFEIPGEEWELDIHVYSGYEALVSEKLTKFMLANQRLIKEYENLKQQSSFSRREYQYQKDLFLNRITESIPENF